MPMKKVLFLLIACSLATAVVTLAQTEQAAVESQRALVSQYCAVCHNENLKSGGFSWADVDLAHPESNADRLEKVIKKVRAGMMPPGRAPRPDAAALKAFVSGIESRLDEAN